MGPRLVYSWFGLYSIMLTYIKADKVTIDNY